MLYDDPTIGWQTSWIFEWTLETYQSQALLELKALVREKREGSKWTFHAGRGRRWDNRRNSPQGTIEEAGKMSWRFLWTIKSIEAFPSLCNFCWTSHSRREGVNFVSKQIIGCILTGIQNPSKWGTYHEILPRALWDMATLMSRQECLKTIFINDFCDFFLRLCNNWNILTIIDPFWYWRSQICDRNGHGKNEILQHVWNHSKKDICNQIWGKSFKPCIKQGISVNLSAQYFLNFFLP